MQTSLRRRHRDRVVRRGIGMVRRRRRPAQTRNCRNRSRSTAHPSAQTIESDFYATEAGRQHFSDQLTVRLHVPNPQSATAHARAFASLVCAVDPLLRAGGAPTACPLPPPALVAAPS
jgi:hypothetical protein